MPKPISSTVLANLASSAELSPRARAHLNLHSDYAEPCQRLLNAIQPGSYISPHRHVGDHADECMIALKGRLALLTFTDGGGIESVTIFGPDTDCVGLEVAAGEWHTVVALESNSVIFETKSGPFDPTQAKAPAPWAPVGETACRRYMAELYRQIDGWRPSLAVA